MEPQRIAAAVFFAFVAGVLFSELIVSYTKAMFNDE